MERDRIDQGEIFKDCCDLWLHVAVHTVDSCEKKKEKRRNGNEQLGSTEYSPFRLGSHTATLFKILNERLI